MNALKRQCINLIVDEMLNIDSKDNLIAALFINGSNETPLKHMSETGLLEEIYARYSFQFTSEEIELISTDSMSNKELKKWIMSKQPHDWCAEAWYEEVNEKDTAD